MIIARAPLRISFVGGGTDLPSFYRQHGGAVLSTSIDKFVSIVANRPPFSEEILLKYSRVEVARSLDEIEHTRFREGMRMFGIESGVEIASFADIPASTGLGSSSSFSVALMRALSALKGESLHRLEAARLATKLEIDILKEPIGPQDQYAAACGGFNILRFNRDDSVGVEPLHLDFSVRSQLQDSCLLFFTGITRSASYVLAKQVEDIDAKTAVYKKMAASVDVFRGLLENGDIKGLGAMLHEGWSMKRSLSSAISNGVIDSLYSTALDAGAYGGKLLGAGGGGCILVLVSEGSRMRVREAVFRHAHDAGLSGFREVPFTFTQSGVELIHRS